MTERNLTEEEFAALTEDERLDYLGRGYPFDRIRRVTGYLSQDFRRWNDGKQAELEDRVKHYIEED